MPCQIVKLKHSLVIFVFTQEVLAYVSTHAQQKVTLDNAHEIYDTLFCEVFIGFICIQYIICAIFNHQ